MSKAELAHMRARIVNKLFDSALADLSLEMQSVLKAHKFSLFFKKNDLFYVAESIFFFLS